MYTKLLNFLGFLGVLFLVQPVIADVGPEDWGPVNGITVGSSAGWVGGPHLRRASLDRIDNSLGYVKGNVRFISIMANYCRNTFEDKDLMEFCEAVVDNIPILITDCNSTEGI